MKINNGGVFLKAAYLMGFVMGSGGFRAGLVVLVGVGTMLFGGCMVCVDVNVPGIKGRVVDGEGRPVGNAVVEVREKGKPASERIGVGADGRFEAGEKSSVVLVPVFGDAFFMPLEVRAVVAGERERWSEPVAIYPNNREVWETAKVVDVGVLRVK